MAGLASSSGLRGPGHTTYPFSALWFFWFRRELEDRRPRSLARAFADAMHASIWRISGVWPYWVSSRTPPGRISAYWGGISFFFVWPSFALQTTDALALTSGLPSWRMAEDATSKGTKVGTSTEYCRPQAKHSLTTVEESSPKSSAFPRFRSLFRPTSRPRALTLASPSPVHRHVPD